MTKAVTLGYLNYHKLNPKFVDIYEKPLMFTYFMDGWATRDVDAVKQALAIWSSPSKPLPQDTPPKGFIDVSKLDKNAAIDDLTQSKSLAVLNVKDYFKQPSSDSDLATINQNNAYFYNLSRIADGPSENIVDGKTGQFYLPRSSKTPASTFGDVSAISKLGHNAAVTNFYAIDLDAKPGDEYRFMLENVGPRNVKDSHHYAIIVTLYLDESTGKNPLDTKVELLNLYMSGSDFKKEFLDYDNKSINLGVNSHREYAPEKLYTGLPDNRPYEFSLISGGGYAFGNNGRMPNLTVVEDLKEHIRNLK